MTFFRTDKTILKHLDWWLLVSLFCIMAMGVINLYSANVATNEPFAMKQALWYTLGLVTITALASLDYRNLQKFVYILYGVTLFSLLLVDIIGAFTKVAQHWLSLVFFNFQPSELAKLTTIILTAHLFSKTGKLNHSFKDILLPAALLAVPFGLILAQPDLGTAVLVALIAVTMVVIAGLRRTTLVLLFLSVISALSFGWHFLKPYQKNRILSFLNSESESYYHILRSKIASGLGQISEKGLLQGTQEHLSFLPEPHTDFAFALWTADWGLVGSIVLLLIYFILLWRGIKIASETNDRFGALLAKGVVIMLFWQISINCAMVMGLFPMVGVSFPLISYGGSSVVMTLAAIGLLLSIKVSKDLNTPPSNEIKGELTLQSASPF